MINCFFDDSGKESHADNKIVSIAGYLASTESYWGLFRAGWRNQLLRRRISWLHMTDLMFDQKEFGALGWDWPKKKEVLEDFIKVIRISELVGFGVAVDTSAWRKIPKEITKIEGDAQQFCFMRIMRMVSDRMMLAAPNDSVSVYFDCDRTFTPLRFQKFIGVRDNYPDAARYLQSFSIAEPKTFLPLQAADLLAWETRKDLERRISGFPSRPEFTSLFKDLAGIFPEYTGEFWDEAEINDKIVKPFMATGQYGER